MGRNARGKQRLQEVPEEEVEQEFEPPVESEGDAGAPGPSQGVLREVELCAAEEAPPAADADADADADSELESAEAREREFWRRVFMSVSLTPFPFAAWPFADSWIGWAIWWNGVAAHMSAGLGLAYSKEVLMYDSVVNCALVLYINTTTRLHLLMGMLTAVAASCWMLNGCLQRRTRSAALHILGVQWPLCTGLWIYEFHL